MTESTGLDDDIPDAIRDEAIDWALKLEEDDPEGELHRAHQRWLHADPRHARAWERITSLENSLSGLREAPRVRPVLQVVREQRRRGVQLLSLLMVFGIGGAWLADPMLHDRLRYDYVAGVGERRSVELGGGAHLELNAGTALDVEISADGEDRIELVRGAVRIRTDGAPLTASRGALTAVPQGTDFGMIAGDGQTEFHVRNGRIIAQHGEGKRSVSLGAGNSATFSEASGRFERGGDAARAMAWTGGMIKARDMTIEDFAKALDPYMRRRIAVDPQVRSLTISGLFPLDDPTVSLEALTDAVPVETLQDYPWRIRIAPADGPGK